MSESIQPTPFRKLNYTPFCDLIRGRVTGRLDVKLAIEGSDLPEPGKALVGRIVRQTRLWRTEKYEVATELIAHFQDGLDQGTTIEELLSRFGDERQAAKLIRRGKIRNRPLIWHAGRAVIRGILACIIFYALAALYFFTGHPTPNVDYIAILNHPAEQIPPDQRAWPIYRDLHLTFYDHGDEKAATQFMDMIYSRPGDVNYPRLMNWLENHQRELDTIRAASAKSALGIIFPSDGVSGELRLAPNWRQEIPLNTPTVGAIVGPYQYMVAQEAGLLCDDAALAAQRSDPIRVIRDVADASRIADQLRGMQSLFACDAAITIRETILNRINDLLVEHPEVLRDEDLAELAHMLGRTQTRSELITYETSRIVARDVIQRMYTTTSFGYECLTPLGVEELIKRTYTSGNELVRKKVLMPLFIIAGPSRSAALRSANQSIDNAQASLNRPFHEIAAASKAKPDIHQLLSNPIACARDLPLLSLSEGPMRQANAERYLGHRDGILIGIALESYRRHHDGNYPTTLAQLRPALMPSLPEDRITGEPLHYRLIDGKPLVYSVGDDRDDDGGRLAQPDDDYPLKSMGHEIIARWVAKDAAHDGDWILYPQPAATR